MASKWFKNKPKMKKFLGLCPEPHRGGLTAPLKPLAALREFLFSPVTQIFLISTTVAHGQYGIIVNSLS